MKQKPAVVGLGEALWDMFPTGPRFGGAPANFVCSLAELAAGQIDVAMVSGVGRDELGAEAIRSLESHGVDTRAVARLDRPTGQVLVTLDAAGHPTYEIATDVAWDHIPWSAELAKLAARADAVCFGTLAQRSGTSRDTILRFVRSTRATCLKVLDINLRQAFWNQAVILESLALAHVLKLNDGELPIVADLVGLAGTPAELLAGLAQKFSLRVVALTRGAEGALLLDAAGECSDLPGQPTKVIDTVGAGDSFTAALVVGLLNDLPLDRINAWGNRVASFVTSQAGATPHFPETLRQPG
jgi:fructokinase